MRYGSEQQLTLITKCRLQLTLCDVTLHASRDYWQPRQRKSWLEVVGSGWCVVVAGLLLVVVRGHSSLTIGQPRTQSDPVHTVSVATDTL
jgi:hypothetical protein